MNTSDEKSAIEWSAHPITGVILVGISLVMSTVIFITDIPQWTSNGIAPWGHFLRCGGSGRYCTQSRFLRLYGHCLELQKGSHDLDGAELCYSSSC
ncbi:MAG: hypothetical protein ACTSW4_04540 [Candidatus Ranarchaeia archaeon]